LSFNLVLLYEISLDLYNMPSAKRSYHLFSIYALLKLLKVHFHIFLLINLQLFHYRLSIS